MEPEFLGNAPLVAGISISKPGDSLVLKKIFYEFGYQGLVPELAAQVLHFADFYGYPADFLDFGKNRAIEQRQIQ